MAKKPTAQALYQEPPHGKQVHYVDLADLDFDADNPRFGRTARAQRSQTEILDFIVGDFGIDDVLSSIAVNGYFVAEPLICREQEQGKRLTVVEGNRRLAACLILIDDPRAKNQQRRVEQYGKLSRESGRAPFDQVPVIKFARHEKEKDLLSYLGVRHIAASQGWDSYAKAAWIARVVENNDLSLKDIALMTGDQHRTVRRLLEGYYFINQLIDDGKFLPETSLRRGRGSNPEFPFSWIYTLFGYPNARKFVGMPDEPVARPIAAARMEDASTIVTSLFGDKNVGRSAAIDDSRQIGGLAAILDDPEKISLLIKGKTLEEIEYETQPIDIKLRDGLTDCKAILSDIVATLDAAPPSESVATAAAPLAKQVANLANSLAKKLLSLQLSELE
jgi:hypothetical protein